MRVDVKLPPKLIPVFLGPARYRGARGGRGSGKTRSFAKMAAITAHRAAQSGKRGIILCVREFMNSLADSSMAEIKEAILSEEWLIPHFDIGDNYIRTACRSVDFSFVGLSRNLDAIKSKAKIILCWADEAEPITETAWTKLIPTVREDGSEIWVTWNPEHEYSATNKRFMGPQPDDVKIVELNYIDNPWFPEVLERERLDDLEKRPENYDHVWGGQYKTYFEGAYFTKQILAARQDGRISVVPQDPHFAVHLFADIGGTGAKADNFVFWAAQFVGQTIKCVNHYEVRSQAVGAHLAWMRKCGYEPGNCKIWLPHDGDRQENTIDSSYRKAFEAADYDVVVVPNQGRGAAMQRVEKVREQFPRIWIDEKKCAAGLSAISSYHENIDEERNVGLGPKHDGSSHSSDAFGLMCVVYEPPRKSKPIVYPKRAIV